MNHVSGLTQLVFKSRKGNKASTTPKCDVTPDVHKGKFNTKVSMSYQRLVSTPKLFQLILVNIRRIFVSDSKDFTS